MHQTLCQALYISNCIKSSHWSYKSDFLISCDRSSLWQNVAWVIFIFGAQAMTEQDCATRSFLSISAWQRSLLHAPGFPRGWQRLCQVFLMVWPLSFPNLFSFFILPKCYFSINLLCIKTCLSICFPEDPADADEILLASINLSSAKGMDILGLDLSQYQQDM